MAKRVGDWTIEIYPHTIRAGKVIKYNAVASGYEADGRWRVKAFSPQDTSQMADVLARYWAAGKDPLGTVEDVDDDGNDS